MEVMLTSWREKSSKTYESQFQKRASWCSARSIDPMSCPIGDVANFLAQMFSEGYQYRSINAYNISAISSVHIKLTNMMWGNTHQCRDSSKVFLPCYTHTWDVGVMTTYIRASGDNMSLYLQDLSHKLAMLMVLTRPSRLADLTKLDLHFRSYSIEGVTFQPSALSTQSRQQKYGTEFFPCYPTE